LEYWRVGVEESPFSSKQSKLGGEKKSGKTEKVVCKRGIEFFNISNDAGGVKGAVSCFLKMETHLS